MTTLELLQNSLHELNDSQLKTLLDIINGWKNAKNIEEIEVDDFYKNLIKNIDEDEESYSCEEVYKQLGLDIC